QLHREEQPAVVLVGLVDFDDVGVPKPGGSLRLPAKTLASLRVVSQLGADQLQGDRTFQPELRGAVDDSHAAATEYPFDPVPGNRGPLVGGRVLLGGARRRQIRRRGRYVR